MSVLFIVIPAALLLAGAAVAAFMWAARSGQLDDVESPPLRMLLDDEGDAIRPKPEPKAESDGD